jgi:hypothetical protein
MRFILHSQLCTLHFLFGGHKAVVRPDPIPNSAVKHSLADGSGLIDSARVGCRQSFLKSRNASARFGFFGLTECYGMVIETSRRMSTWSASSTRPNSCWTRFGWLEGGHELNQLQRLIENNQRQLLESWDEYFNE